MDFWIAASYLKAPALPTLVFCLRVFVCLLLANTEQSAQCYTLHDTERHWVLFLWQDMTCVAPQCHKLVFPFGAASLQNSCCMRRLRECQGKASSCCVRQQFAQSVQRGHPPQRCGNALLKPFCGNRLTRPLRRGQGAAKDTVRRGDLPLKGDMTSVAPQRRAKCFIKNAFQLCGTPFPLRLLDIIRPSGWSNIGAVNPFNIISLLAAGNYSTSFSMGIARSTQPNLE